MKNFLFIVVAVCLSVSVAAEKTEVSSGQYYAGGAVGSILGWGIGHAIQGRYKEIGWVFTVGEGAAAAASISGAAWMASSLPTGLKWRDAKSSDFSKGGLALACVGAVAMVGFRIWEIVDVWVGATPVDGTPKTANLFNKDEGRFAGATELGVAAFNVPLLSYNF